MVHYYIAINSYLGQIANAQDFRWVKGIGGTVSKYAYSIALDAFGNVCTTGSFQGTKDFNPGLGTYLYQL